jgi:topoisomerase IV subunit B
MNQEVAYNEDNIQSLDWKAHIRLRPGMYIGKLGDGAAPDDGIYVLIKEIIDNSIDEFVMGYGKTVEIRLEDSHISVRDFGRGIPLGKVIECVSQINTGGKYDSKAFKKSVGLNGVGTKAVNALASYFKVVAIRDGQMKVAEFTGGELSKEHPLQKTDLPNGTLMQFKPDNTIFKQFKFKTEFIESQLWNYAYLNSGLKLLFNGKTFASNNGLLDLLTRKIGEDAVEYPVIFLKGADIEIAMTHGRHYGEQYHTFVNGQNTTQGGTHLMAFKEAVVRVVREHFNKTYEPQDIRASIIAAISVRIEEPVFESQTKTKLGSQNIAPEGASLRTFVSDFLKKALDDFLHKNKTVADALKRRIEQNERERKEIAGIKKIATERAKKANIHNKKLRDCRFHWGEKGDAVKNAQSTLFITEGDSASGSITKSRNVETQAVFSLRGKPLNCYGLTKKVVYQNEEFNLLQHALNIEDGIEYLRYNRVVISTDADVDGMHIRLLMLTFFLQFFPDLVRNGHLYILQTPLFRVRDKKNTYYCYSEGEKQAAIRKLKGNAEITRFKGLGEISPDEFGAFIGEDIRLEPVVLTEDCNIDQTLEYYMGKNTPERQDFIIENLRLELEEIEDALEIKEAMQAAV